MDFSSGEMPTTSGQQHAQKMHTMRIRIRTLKHARDPLPFRRGGNFL